jgi:murein L,D-transpeptidase YafK
MLILTFATAMACPPLLQGEDARAAGPAVMVVSKSERWLGLYRAGELVPEACWPVAFAPGAPQGTKRRRGDLATPEGWYRTTDKPWSSFPGAIAVHYPNALDAAWGLREGLLSRAQHEAIKAAVARGALPDQGTAMGGEILVHGGGSSRDWTLGCVALEDEDLGALRAALPAGMRAWIWIRP